MRLNLMGHILCSNYVMSGYHIMAQDWLWRWRSKNVPYVGLFFYLNESVHTSWGTEDTWGFSDEVVVRGEGGWGRSCSRNFNPGQDSWMGSIPWRVQFFCPYEKTLVQTCLCLTLLRVCMARTQISAHVKDPTSICRKRAGLTAGGMVTLTKMLHSILKKLNRPSDERERQKSATAEHVSRNME